MYLEKLGIALNHLQHYREADPLFRRNDDGYRQMRSKHINLQLVDIKKIQNKKFSSNLLRLIKISRWYIFYGIGK